MEKLPTIDKIDELLVRLFKETVMSQGKDTHINKVLRFGQFVYNQIGYETDNSYWITNHEEAYKNICAVLNYKNASLA